MQTSKLPRLFGNRKDREGELFPATTNTKCRAEHVYSERAVQCCRRRTTRLNPTQPLCSPSAAPTETLDHLATPFYV